MRPDPDRRAFRPAELNALYSGASAQVIVNDAVAQGVMGRTALVSSFGATSVVLLHLVARAAPDTPVLFLETGMLFPETLAYQREVAERLGLSNVQTIHPGPGDEAGTLHQSDPDACCDLRKTQPLHRALAPYDAWITGRRASGHRAMLDVIEVEPGTSRLKINPLARWSAAEMADYIDRHDLPRHPLVARGFPSIGCAPCTSRVAEGEDERAGRWRGIEKLECGIHFGGTP